MRAYLVNLARATDRRKSMLEAFDRAGVACELFEAIDGSVDDPRSPFPLAERTGRYGMRRSRSEMACFASHYRLWQTCVELDEPIAVFEDDLVLLDGLADALARAGELVGDDLLRLFGLVPREALVLRELPGGDRLVQYLKGPTGTQAYVVSPAAARRFIEDTHPILDPVDEYMDRFWEHGVRSLALLPWRIDDAAIGSDIERRAPLRGLAKLRFKLVRQVESARRRRWLASHAPAGAPVVIPDPPGHSVRRGEDGP